MLFDFTLEGVGMSQAFDGKGRPVPAPLPDHYQHLVQPRLRLEH